MNTRRLGFTIVELLVVIVVIGILAGVTIIGYGAWRNDVIEKQLESDLTGAAGAMENGRNFGSEYPSSLPATFKPSDGVSMTAKAGGGTYCIQASPTASPNKVFNIKNGRKVTAGGCEAYYTFVTPINSNTSCGVEYGKAYCWGDAGLYGSLLGNGSSVASSRPVAVNTSIMTGKVTAIASSNAAVCAIADGSVYCWGNGSGGLLGNGTTTNSTVPVAVDKSIMNGRVTSIAMGGTSACAVAGGKVYCWGVGTSGQLGNGSSPPYSASPVAVATSLMTGSVTSISKGGAHTCAIADAKVYCWGTNGALGNSTSASSSSPVAVTTTVMTGPVTYIQAAYSHTCAISVGKAYCWGAGSYSPTAYGQLGNGSSLSRTEPVAVDTSIMSGTVTQLKTNSALTCAIADEKAYCWGENSAGQLGDGTTTTSSVPVAVDTSTMSKEVTSINLYQHVCATSDNKLYCWGPGTQGQLGNGASLNSSRPVAVNTSNMTGKITATSLGFQFSCALSNDRPYCWGINNKGQLGNGNTTLANTPALLVLNP